MKKMGDCLAMEYGGSQMHRQMAKDKSEPLTMPVLYRNRDVRETMNQILKIRCYEKRICISGWGVVDIDGMFSQSLETKFGFVNPEKMKGVLFNLHLP